MPDSRLRRALAPGIDSARAHWRPFVAIQVATAIVVLAYYASPAFRSACSGLAEAKVRGGYVFSAIAGGIAGGLMPELAKSLTLSGSRKTFLGDALWNGLIFAIIGVQVDALYQFQAFLFGAGHEPLVLAKKVAVDQFVYTPFMSIPLTVGMVRWRKKLSDPGILFRNWSKAGFRDVVAPNLPTAWVFWIPVLVCVYSMPTSLQYCLSVMAEAAWSLLFVFAAQQKPEP